MIPIVSYKLRFVPRKGSYDDIYTVRRGLQRDPKTGEKLKDPEFDTLYIYKWIDNHYWWCGCRNQKTNEDIYERELKKEDPNHDFGNPPEGKKCPN
ncbi:MAG: hypothetical protein H0X72_08045 [Acidobacteria bacterium]|nr:hypothetical protein [Acidobacteriota bacterium]